MYERDADPGNDLSVVSSLKFIKNEAGKMILDDKAGISNATNISSDTVNKFLNSDITKNFNPTDIVNEGLRANVGTSGMELFLSPQTLSNANIRQSPGGENILEPIRENYNIPLIHADESELFLDNLEGQSDPETKRKIIGRLFIDVFQKYANKIENAEFLAQGTLYPDVIESVSFKGGPSVTIKSHHNVGGLPKKMKLKLIEPLKYLFKDEVRKLGLEIKLGKEIVFRHPFPGPGLAIRMPGIITDKKIKILQEADQIYITELKKHNLYNKIWQAYAALLPVKTVGVMGDNRTYEYICLLRAITSEDGMTADFFNFNKKFMQLVSNKIINNIRGINRVVYDVTSKPPSTIELE